MTDPIRAALQQTREALAENHQWHQDHDDHDGYPGSDLETTNVAAIAAADAALAAAPQPVALTDDDIWLAIGKGIDIQADREALSPLRVARAVERLMRERAATPPPAAADQEKPC